jgi:uracil-DNA glycosylase
VTDWREIHDATSAPKVLPLPHPSWRNSGWIKKNPWFETELLPFLRSETSSRIS